MTTSQEPMVDDSPSLEQSTDRALDRWFNGPHRHSFSAEQYIHRFKRQLDHSRSQLTATTKGHLTAERHTREYSMSKPTQSPFTFSMASALAATPARPHQEHQRKNGAPSLPKDHALKNPILQEPISIRPIRLRTFIAEGTHRYWSDLTHPQWIPGRNLWERVYSLGALPFLIGFVLVCQWCIAAFVWWTGHTRSGQYLYKTFLRDQIHIYDAKNVIDPKGNKEALRLLAQQKPQDQPNFDYHIAHLLLICSSLVYERDDKLVEEAFKLLQNINTDEQRIKAKELLMKSERSIDERAQKQFGMRFMGISELKTLGGPFAGLFYNDDCIVLVYKGTSVLAFHEYLIDTTIYRVHADEYLYGEVHKGFYESLFPDPEPRDDYERRHFDPTNPFATIMESIIQVATKAKARTGKPLNLWITGHSLGGALAAMTMARLQKPLQDDDPMLKDHPGVHASSKNRPKDWTVWDELLTRATQPSKPSSSSSSSPLSNLFGIKDDNDKKRNKHNTLLHLRDCYSFASPRLCDSDFAIEFNRNEIAFCERSPFKPVYWRIVADMDIVPMMPPGCSSDTDHVDQEKSKCEPCRSTFHTQKSHHHGTTASPDRLTTTSQQTLYESSDSDTDSTHSTDSTASVGSSSQHYQLPAHGQHQQPQESSNKQLRPYKSLLDYTHIGQLVRVSQYKIPPAVKPSRFETKDYRGLVVRSPFEVFRLLECLKRHPDVSKECVTVGGGKDGKEGHGKHHEKREQRQKSKTGVKTGTTRVSTSSSSSSSFIRTTTTTTSSSSSFSSSSSSSSTSFSSSSSSSSSFSFANVSTLQLLVSLRCSNLRRTIINAIGWSDTDREPQTLEEWYDAFLQDLVQPASLDAYQPKQLEHQQFLRAQQQQQQLEQQQEMANGGSHSKKATPWDPVDAAHEQLTMYERLRKPCDAEQVMLSFPGIFSHSPAAYERNLVRARFYFKTFPGRAYGEMVDLEEEQEDDDGDEEGSIKEFMKESKSYFRRVFKREHAHEEQC